jgi:hypothetical protein
MVGGLNARSVNQNFGSVDVTNAQRLGAWTSQNVPSIFAVSAYLYFPKGAVMSSRVRLFVLVLMLTLGATSLFALPDNEIQIDYYTDATLGEWCGYRYYVCGPNWVAGGCRTSYSTYYEGPDC